VDAAQPLVRVFAKRDVAERVRPMVLGALQVSDELPTTLPLVLDRIS
jgi:hypothetical protein